MNGRRLVVGLGNPLAGDDGIGARVAERLASDPRRPADIDVLVGGADLFRLADELRGRPGVFLLDAFLTDAPPGTVVRFDGDLDGSDGGGRSAHQLNPVEALGVLRATDREIAAVPVTLLAIAIGEARVATEISSGLAEQLDSLVDRVTRELADRSSPA